MSAWSRRSMTSRPLAGCRLPPCWTATQPGTSPIRSRAAQFHQPQVLGGMMVTERYIHSRSVTLPATSASLSSRRGRRQAEADRAVPSRRPGRGEPSWRGRARSSGLASSPQRKPISRELEKGASQPVAGLVPGSQLSAVYAGRFRQTGNARIHVTQSFDFGPEWWAAERVGDGRAGEAARHRPGPRRPGVIQRCRA